SVAANSSPGANRGGGRPLRHGAGEYWQYHDRLFENQNKLDKPSLIEHATGLGLNPKQFETCLDSGKYSAQIEEDVQAGNRLGVTGTPAFFINGVLVSGAQPVSVFENRIAAELAAHAQQRSH